MAGPIPASGVADEATMNLKGDGGDSWGDRRRKRRADNKTVTFGDASAVQSLPAWSVLSLVLLLGLWYVLTKAWGYPEAFAATLDPEITADRDLYQQCQLSAECDPDSYTQFVRPIIFPSPKDTGNAFVELFTDGYRNISLWEHTWASLWRVIRGMFWGSLVGIPVGLSMGLSSRARGFFDTIVEAFRPIPPLALLPLFILSFGIGKKSAVPLLVFASLWIMIIAARAGIKNVKLSKVRAAYSLGASKPQVLRRVLIPNALPDIFTGIRVALGVSWGTLVAAEISGINDGLGAMIIQAKNFSRLDIIVCGIVIIAVIGVLMDVLIRFLESILIPWQGKG